MKLVRCAIYTRKSSDEGLDQAFNSLDAQREACAAYILSQASEGWVALPEVYDDGGLSGGTLERPALKRLLAEVAAGRVDTIVVYKVDRLTRSLFDFAKLVETFDASGTSFVSVTQSFNTTTSMGRLTLNMLLSFAQFEREVTAERIRDKIAASKAKGMWMGGTPPLGYKPDGRTLAVVPEHAAIVRDVFDRYLTLGNVRLVTEQLAAAGICSPVRVIAKTGTSFGGVPLSRGQIYKLLSCPTYVGEVHHAGKAYPGLHEAIVDRETWDRAQARLADNSQGQRERTRAAQPSLLAGRIVDEAGAPLIATHACKGKVRHRYYVSRDPHHGTQRDGIRLPAREIELLVIDQLHTLLADPLTLAARAWLNVAPADVHALHDRCSALAAQLSDRRSRLVTEIVAQVAVTPTAVVISIATESLAAAMGLALHPDASATLQLTSAARLTRTGRAVRLVQDGGTVLPGSPDPALLRAIVQARRWWAILRAGELTVGALAAQEGVTQSYLTRILRLAFLAPKVTAAILAGQQKVGTTTASLTLGERLSPDWSVQQLALLPLPAAHPAA